MGTGAARLVQRQFLDNEIFRPRFDLNVRKIRCGRRQKSRKSIGHRQNPVLKKSKLRLQLAGANMENGSRDFEFLPGVRREC